MHKIARKSSTFVQNPCRARTMRRFALIFFFSALLAVSCRQSGYYSFTGYAQGGEYVVKANLDGVREVPETIGSAIDSILNDIDFSLSGYNRNSLLSKFNSGEDVVPDRYFNDVLEMSEEYRQITGGAFDVTAGPLFDIWGFGFKTDSLPSDERVRLALEECRSGRILNFNAIAQGYSCDVIAGYLRSIGVRDMLVNIGEIYCEGLNPAGKPWSVGVDNPVDGNNSPGKDMRGVWNSEGRSCGIVTSGNYRKYYVKDGKKYAHTIDPRTGYPVCHDLLSATVVAPTAAQADAFATACMVMGPEDARKFILSRNDVEGYLITSEGTWNSPGFPLSD